MADDELPERSDPVLVRPYITTEPGSAGPDRSEETWPEEAALPDDGTSEFEAVTEADPQPGPGAKSAALLRQRMIVLGGVLVLAIVAAGFVLFGASGDEDEPPPATAQPTLAAPSVVSSPGAAPFASGASRSVSPSSSGSPSTSVGTSASVTATPSGQSSPGAPAVPPPAAGGSAPPVGAAPTATLAPAPDKARVGAVTAASGRCLILGGLFAIDGSPVQVTGCANVSYQKFTLATDGTLQVAGKCAEVTDDGTVRTNDCDDRKAEQWRAGPDNSLVNPATGKCLVDPGNVGANTRVASCTGAADQSWTLP